MIDTTLFMELMTNEEKIKKINKHKVVVPVVRCYADIELLFEEFAYLFDDTMYILCKRSTPYLYKLVALYILVLPSKAVEETAK